MINSISFIKTQNGSYINPYSITTIESNGNGANLKLISGETVKLNDIKTNTIAQSAIKAANTGEIIDIKG